MAKIMSGVRKIQTNHRQLCPFKTQTDKVFFNPLKINPSIFREFCPFKTQTDKKDGQEKEKRINC